MDVGFRVVILALWAGLVQVGCATSQAASDGGGSGAGLSAPLIESCEGRQAYACAVQAEQACPLPEMPTGNALILWSVCLASQGAQCAVASFPLCPVRAEDAGESAPAVADSGGGGSEIGTARAALRANCQDVAGICAHGSRCHDEASCVAAAARCLELACR